MSQTEAKYRQGTTNGCLFKIEAPGLSELIWKSFITYKGGSKSIVSSKNQYVNPPKTPDTSAAKSASLQLTDVCPG